MQRCNGADGVSRDSQYGISYPSGQRCNGADFVNVVEVVDPAEAVNMEQVVQVVTGANGADGVSSPLPLQFTRKMYIHTDR